MSTDSQLCHLTSSAIAKLAAANSQNMSNLTVYRRPCLGLCLPFASHATRFHTAFCVHALAALCALCDNAKQNVSMPLCRFAHLAGVRLSGQELEKQLDACLEAVELDYLLTRCVALPPVYITFLPLACCWHQCCTAMHVNRCSMPSIALHINTMHTLPSLPWP